MGRRPHGEEATWGGGHAGGGACGEQATWGGGQVEMRPRGEEATRGEATRGGGHVEGFWWWPS